MSDQAGPRGDGGTPPRPKQRADPLGSWITGGLIGVALGYYLWQARELPSDIQRWPMWLSITGLLLLGLYALQQMALTREWRVVDTIDEVTLAAEQTEDASVTAALERAAGDTEPDAVGDESDASDESLAEDRDATQYGNPDDYTRRGDWMTAGALGSFVLFAVAAYGFGYLPAAMIFVPTYMFANGERHVGKLVGLTLGTGASIYMLFGYVLFAPLTRGEWFRTDWLIDWIPL